MDNINEVLSKKAFEVNYAVFRVSNILKNARFSQYIENYALDLLSSILSKNYTSTRGSIAGLIYFLRLGGEVELVNHNIVQTLIHELEVLDSAIAEHDAKLVLPDLDLKGVFSGVNFSAKNTNDQKEATSEIFGGERKNEPRQVLEVRPLTTVVGEEDHGLAGENSNHMSPIVVSEYNSATMRQSAILDKIRQSGYCRLKDVQDIIPNSSERTLRYDLQKLVDQGQIERIGSGGPASFYRLRRSEKVE